MQSLVIDKNILIQSTLQFPDRREFWPSYHLEIPPCALVCRLKRIQLIMTDGHKICHSSDELMRGKLDKYWETDYALMIICVKSIICVLDTYYNLLEEKLLLTTNWHTFCFPFDLKCQWQFLAWNDYMWKYRNASNKIITFIVYNLKKPINIPIFISTLLIPMLDGSEIWEYKKYGSSVPISSQHCTIFYYINLRAHPDNCFHKTLILKNYLENCIYIPF